MNTLHRSPLVFLLVLLAAPGFSQDANATSKEKKPQTEDPKEESSKSGGLRKISTRDPRNWNFDFKIDEKALAENINSAVERAMQSVDVQLEKIEINIEPIEIDLRNLNMDINPIEVRIPHMNIDVQPIEIDMEDIHADAHGDRHHFDFDDDNDHDNDAENDDDDDDDDKSIRKDKSPLIINKHKKVHHSDSDAEENEKAKGLKKLN